ncbi:unnamed protein product, partial [Mesorhabditis belari]|uniref:G-protein coupled receptors family 1 profile domain-containing protein n=1 Tax=Mesorhabditis belari TaxID=2138241 RepID=A0AAF3FRC1_9BILA
MSTKLDPNSPICLFTVDIMNNWAMEFFQGLNFEMFLLNGRDCDGLLFEPGACFPLRIVFDFGIYGQTISLLGIAIERYCAISMTNRYKFVSSTLGLVLTTFVIVFTMALVLYVHFHEDPTELQFNCGPVTRTAASAANILPPYYALVLPPFIVFMLRRIELQRKMSIEAITSSWQVEKNPPSVIQEKLKSTSPNDHHNRVTPFQA